MTTPTQAQGLSFLQVLKDETIILFAPAVSVFTNAINVNPTPLGVAGAWIQMQGSLVSNALISETALIQQLNALVISKVEEQVAAAKAQLGVT